MKQAVERAIGQLSRQRNKLCTEVDALQAKIAGLDAAITLLREATTENHSPVRPAYKITELLIEFLLEVETRGLNSQIAIDMAARRGIYLNQKSVSSLLSRMRRSGLTVYENHRYRHRKFTSIVRATDVRDLRIDAA